jgi:hypothetical protein
MVLLSLPRRGRVDVEGGRVGVAQRVFDQREYTLQIVIDVVVPKAQYSEPLIGKIIVALHVTACMHIKIMLTTINLDDDAPPEADEIDNIALARSLAAEVKSPTPP